MRVTVCLSAQSNGRKLQPYVLVKNKRPIPRIMQKFKGKLHINWAGSIWMNDATTEDYLRRIIGGKLFSEKRLLVWDAFGSYKSEATTDVLKDLDIEAIYIPGGCTKFIQAPDVCWNKPFKERIIQFYNLWMLNGDRREWTAAGNPKAPALEIVLEWIYSSWQELSKELIIKSFEVCALTTLSNGSGDYRINCFKPDGMIGVKGLEILREVRAADRSKDGRSDYEEAGFPDQEEEVDIEGVTDDENLFYG